MNEFKGTKGKWKITNNNLSEDGGFVMIGTDKHIWIAETKGCHVGTNNKEAEANAKLIACAPDMLEMLKIMGDALLELMNHQDGWEDDYENLKQLIKKAT